MRLIFIRHGETKKNIKKLTHKTGDSTKLTKKGIRQIKECTPILKENKVEIIYYSPEKRAKESADIISKKIKIKVLKDFKERNWGKWEGRPWEDIKSVLDKMSLKERYNFIPPKGESWKSMELRLKKALKLIIKGEEKCICIITHMGSLRGLMPIINNEPKESSFKYEFENGSITIFDFEKGKYKEILVNNVSHLDK